MLQHRVTQMRILNSCKVVHPFSNKDMHAMTAKQAGSNKSDSWEIPSIMLLKENSY